MRKMGIRLHNLLMEVLIVSGGLWFIYQAVSGGLATGGG